MIRPIVAILRRNLVKFGRDRMRLFLNLLMSGIFLFIFSFVTRSPSAGLEHPINYLIAGIVIMAVFQTSLNNSMGILEDISSGFMKEVLVSPIRRWQIAVGQILSSSAVSLFQGLLLLGAGVFLGLRLDAIHVLLVVGVMAVSALGFGSVGLHLAALTKGSSNYQLLVTLLAFPLTFLSGAYIPVTMLPGFLRPIVYLNPLTYATAAFRSVMLGMDGSPVNELVRSGIAFPIVGGYAITPGFSTLLVLVMGSVFLVLAVRRFSRADFSTVKVFRHQR